MERPTGVTILAVLSFLAAAASLLAACGMFLLGAAGLATMSGGRTLGGPLAALGAFAGVALLVFAVIYIINGVGLLKLCGWGRMLTIVLIAIGVVFGVMGLFGSLAQTHVALLVWQLIVLAIDVWILVYMFKPHVKQAFGQSA